MENREVLHDYDGQYISSDLLRISIHESRGPGEDFVTVFRSSMRTLRKMDFRLFRAVCNSERLQVTGDHLVRTLFFRNASFVKK